MTRSQRLWRVRWRTDSFVGASRSGWRRDLRPSGGRTLPDHARGFLSGAHRTRLQLRRAVMTGIVPCSRSAARIRLVSQSGSAICRFIVTASLLSRLAPSISDMSPVVTAGRSSLPRRSTSACSVLFMATRAIYQCLELALPFCAASTPVRRDVAAIDPDGLGHPALHERGAIQVTASCAPAWKRNAVIPSALYVLRKQHRHQR